MCAEHTAVRGLLESFTDDDVVAILDMGASPEPFSRGTPKSADAMVIVAEPYYKALEAAVRLVALSKQLGIPEVGLLANKIRDDEQRAAVDQLCENNDIRLWGVVPYDELFARADMEGVAPLDMDGRQSSAVEEIKRLSRVLVP
jgi:CO dehydrogenase maturation factor